MRRPNFNQARICVLGFSAANRVWLVSRFYNCQLPSIGSGQAGIDRIDFV